MKKLSKKRFPKGRGFTLIELLVVIGIIGILAAIVIVAINPGRQFAQARNAQRWNDVNAMLNAVHQYAVDHNGSVPTGIDASYRMIGTAGSGCDTTCNAAGVATVTTEAACLNLTSDLVPTYVTALATDPTDGTAGNTGYYIQEDATTGRVTVAACTPELDADIIVSR